MKQKYIIVRSEDKKELIIKEFAELDKETMSLLCEETYDMNAIASAIGNGKEALIGALRTPNMYPVRVYADRIADSVISLYESDDQESAEIFFDDFDYLSTTRKKAAAVKKPEDDAGEIDELIDDEFEADYEEKPSIGKINTSVNVDEDDLAEFEEDS